MKHYFPILECIIQLIAIAIIYGVCKMFPFAALQGLYEIPGLLFLGIQQDLFCFSTEILAHINLPEETARECAKQIRTIQNLIFMAAAFHVVYQTSFIHFVSDPEFVLQALVLPMQLIISCMLHGSHAFHSPITNMWITLHSVRIGYIPTWFNNNFEREVTIMNLTLLSTMLARTSPENAKRFHSYMTVSIMFFIHCSYITMSNLNNSMLHSVSYDCLVSEQHTLLTSPAIVRDNLWRRIPISLR